MNESPTGDPVARAPMRLREGLPAGRRFQRVLLAVSGGGDSMAMLHAFVSAAGETGDELHVGHFDHGWRGDSADDAAFVADWCGERAVPCHLGRATDAPAGGPSREDAARRRRYAFLSDLAKRLDAPVVVTAHTANDQVETVLHAVLRGTGLRGLSGMRPVRRLADGVSLWRPLLGLRREELDAYRRRHGVPCRDDPSNADTAYTRNRLRNDVLPALRGAGFARVDESLLRLAEVASQARDVVADAARRLAEDAAASDLALDDGAVRIPIAVLRPAPDVVLVEYLSRVWDERGWPRGAMTMRHWRAIRAVITGERRGVQLPGRVFARRERAPVRVLVLRREPEPPVPGD